MTDQPIPQTEAGRRLLARVQRNSATPYYVPMQTRDDILAIEAQARTEALTPVEKGWREVAYLKGWSEGHAAARTEALDVDALARALCWERGPDGGFEAGTIHVDDECRGMASRLAREYAAILAAKADR